MSRPSTCELIAENPNSMCSLELGVMVITGTLFVDLEEETGAAILISDSTKVHVASCFFIRCHGTGTASYTVDAISITNGEHTTVVRCLFWECMGSHSTISVNGTKSGLVIMAQNDFIGNVRTRSIYTCSLKSSFRQMNFTTIKSDISTLAIYISYSPHEVQIRYNHFEGNSSPLNTFFLSSYVSSDTVIVRDVVVCNCVKVDYLIYVWTCHAKVYNMNTIGCSGALAKMNTNNPGKVYVYDSLINHELTIDTDVVVGTIDVGTGETFLKRLNDFLYPKIISNDKKKSFNAFAYIAISIISTK